MTNVIAFRATSKPRAPRRDPQDGAEILFFMGVRYVREEDGGPQAQPVPPDRLNPCFELVDQTGIERLLA